PWFVSVAKAVREAWKNDEFMVPNNIWQMRNLTVREGTRTGDRMVVLTVSSPNAEFDKYKNMLEKFTACIQEAVKPFSGNLNIFLRIQHAQRGEPTNTYELCLHGKNHMQEQVWLRQDSGKPPIVLNFNISPATFFHHNVFQAEELYTLASKLVNLPPG